MASEGGEEGRHAGKVTDIGKGTKSFPAEAKGHMVSPMVYLVLIIFSTRASWNQLTVSTEVSF